MEQEFTGSNNGFCGERKLENLEKMKKANNKLNPTMALGLRSKPGAHGWKVSISTTEPSERV